MTVKNDTMWHIIDKKDTMWFTYDRQEVNVTDERHEGHQLNQLVYRCMKGRRPQYNLQICEGQEGCNMIYRSMKVKKAVIWFTYLWRTRRPQYDLQIYEGQEDHNLATDVTHAS